MADAGAAHGSVICCGSFMPEARAFARRNGITLVDGPALARMISEVRKDLDYQPVIPADSRQPVLQTAPSARVSDAPLCPS